MRSSSLAHSISIANLPEDLVRRLKARAARHGRSLEGEILAVLEEALCEEALPLDVREVARRVSAPGLRTPAEAAAWVRRSRDG
ncbi:MAG TPA: Arc family DNA-binding protein [Chromatiales bacterium]|nr:Arc family DNA-binding protein [Chromatiales bacterium]